MDLRRVGGLPTYVFDVVDGWKAEAARHGEQIIDFGIGSPDLPTPTPIVDRLVTEARLARNHGYPTSPGLSDVREALAAWYSRRFGVVVDPGNQVLVTWGASEALSHLPWVLLEPGDCALVPEPCYPIHRYSVLFSGAEAIGVPMSPESSDDAGLMDAVQAAWDGAPVKPRAVLLSFPHNPTTRCVDIGFFERLVAFARRHDIAIVHDFAYADIAFDGFRPPSILQVRGAADVAVELVSLSKSHNMAGWRLGFVTGNAKIVAGLARLKSYLDYGVTKPVQLMALTALSDCDQYGLHMAQIYQERRDLLCDGLNAAGWPVARPRGTMFVWARIPEAFRAHGSLAFAKHLFDTGHVAVSPGIGFGPGGDEHVRLALVQPPDAIERALLGIQRVLNMDPAGGGGPLIE